MEIFLRYVSDPGYQSGVANNIGMKRSTVNKTTTLPSGLSGSICLFGSILVSLFVCVEPEVLSVLFVPVIINHAAHQLLPLMSPRFQLRVFIS